LIFLAASRAMPATGRLNMTRLSCGLHVEFIRVWLNGNVVNNQNTREKIMKTVNLLCSVLAAGLLAGCRSEENEASEATQAQLLAQAKVSKAQAEQIALAKVPNGTVKDSELEKEKGKLIWSLAFTIPDSKDIKEVNVDAITGDVVGDVETETPAEQAREAAEDAAKNGTDTDKD
jgi:uncharacterized membrane protein YkoI